MAAILASLLPTILPALGALIVTGLGFLTTTINRKMNAESAWAKLANIGVALAGKAWSKLGPEVQKALVDGKITAEERAAIELAAVALIDEVADKATLEAIAKAVGLPVPGIIAWLAESFIDRWTKAHDPDLQNTQSPLAFPVADPGSYGG